MRQSKRASDLKFKTVGRTTPKTSRFAFKFDQHLPKQSLFEGEMLPDEQQKPKQKRQSIYSAIEDPRISRFSYSKIVIIQKNLLILTVLILFMGMIKVQIDQTTSFEGPTSRKMMLVMDLTTIIIVLLTIFRKVTIFELQIEQRKLYLVKKQRTNRSSYFYLMAKNKEYMIELLVQILMVIPHPTNFFNGLNYQFYNQNYGLTLIYSFNDLLSVLMVIKIYIVIRSIVSLSMFATPRAIRMCLYNNIDHNFFFVFKCLQQEYPLRCTTVIFGLSLLIFGYGFRVTQGQLSHFNDISKNGFQNFSNCYWCAFITMATIGYGDYIPTASLAQFQAIILAIIGVVLNSQLIMALTDYLKMKISQVRSHTTLQRLIQQDQLKKEAASAFVQSIKIANFMTERNNSKSKKKINPYFAQLKGKIDVAKSHHKHVKAIIPSQTLTQQMIKSFQLLKDNFKQVYAFQNKVKRKIQQVQQNKNFKYEQMRKSFIDQMSNIMTKISRKKSHV